MKILILGGTGEARELAVALADAGHDTVTSLAGRTQNANAIAGDLRIGPFGGVDGLARALTDGGYTRLVDATHPYAAQISANAVNASQRAGVPLLRLVRPAWRPEPGDQWQPAADLQLAASLLPAGARVLLTTGHGGLSHFTARTDCTFAVRLIEPPLEPFPIPVEVILSRPPHTLENELTLMKRLDTSHLVTKNAGGHQTAAKLAAARQLDIPVVMVERPVLPAAEEVVNVAEAIDWVHLSS